MPRLRVPVSRFRRDLHWLWVRFYWQEVHCAGLRSRNADVGRRMPHVRRIAGANAARTLEMRLLPEMEPTDGGYVHWVWAPRWRGQPGELRLLVAARQQERCSFD